MCDSLDISGRRLLVPKKASEGLQPFFQGFVGRGAAFLPEREIQVIEFVALNRPFNTLPQLGSQTVLLADRAENGDSAVLEFHEVPQSSLQLVELLPVEAGREISSVAGNVGRRQPRLQSRNELQQIGEL